VGLPRSAAMTFTHNVRGEAGALMDVALGLIGAIKECRIELPVTVNLNRDDKIEVSPGMDRGTYQLRIHVKEVSQDGPQQSS